MAEDSPDDLGRDLLDLSCRPPPTPPMPPSSTPFDPTKKENYDQSFWEEFLEDSRAFENCSILAQDGQFRQHSNQSSTFQFFIISVDYMYIFCLIVYQSLLFKFVCLLHGHTLNLQLIYTLFIFKHCLYSYFCLYLNIVYICLYLYFVYIYT